LPRNDGIDATIPAPANPGGVGAGLSYGSHVPARVVVIDNYDSFVYNLVQYLGELGVEPVVRRHDQATIAELRDLEPDAVLVSPGPGRPEDAGVSNAAIRDFGERGVPVLGVCLGHQCIGQVYGGEIVRAPTVMHGKTSEIHHDDAGVFAGLPDPITATRYHSLVVARDSVPDALAVTAETDDGLVMGLRHQELPIEGVQFHPESILTESGHSLLENFLRLCADRSPTG
jgi:anthranilate synthase/aminodeoxychorismate synthase-like glutamine amidotransferase